MDKRTVNVVWFKRDLRVQDHRPLREAAGRGAVLPLFVAEPALWQQPDHAARQWAFVEECLTALRDELAALGQPLLVRRGRVIDWLRDLQKRYQIAGLWSHQETGCAWTYERDLAVAAWCREQGIPWHEYRQNGVIRRLGDRDGWARRWDRFIAREIVAPPAALPGLADVEAGDIPDAGSMGLDADPCPARQRGGRHQAVETLDGFLRTRGRHYRTAMSSPVTAFDQCSRLSPHLAWGTVSLREVTQATRARQEAVCQAESASGWRGSLRSFTGRLHWHCHFMQKLEDQPALEFEPLHPDYRGLRPREPDAERLHAWAVGQTGLPFVDACMRALRATGWMNFRMRAMLMAVASYHLWLDWRASGEHLARCFTDFEPGIHWPQVQMQSGTTGINAVRIYNPVKQGYDQDPDGGFVRRWVPELADVPDALIHEPWRWEHAGRVLDRAYPFPIVDHLEAAKAARQRIWAVRRSDGHGEQAARVQQRHGSRRRREPTRRKA